MKQTVAHPFHPISDEQSSILILGTMPSAKSREVDFYYGHPRNRFWTVLAACFCERAPETADEKTRLLLSNGLALWDVLASCEISGSEDSSISDPVYNDLHALISAKPIRKVLCNGKKAFTICRRLALPIPVLSMPSTSPANAAWGVEQLTAAWKSELSAGG